MDLFEYERGRRLAVSAPLAQRMRPGTLAEFVGQAAVVGKGALLYRAIMADRLTSVILYGPPGTGKTTLAAIIANTTKADFEQLSATTSGVKDVKDVVARAAERLAVSGRRTILFIDEIHRFNKSQQDTLLPHVEQGLLTLIGATTENPYFEVNRALLSRSTIFELLPLAPDDIKTLLRRAMADKDRGLGGYNMEAAEDALDFIADISGGDARAALNALELAALTTEPADGRVVLDLATARQCAQKRVALYDKAGDNHYDIISAFIKSMRGTDPDAAVYYLARMLYAGEDPKFIARRIVICAAEDVGNADPRALQVAVAAAQATDFIGMPECRIILSQAAVYVACAPKSNSAYLAVEAAWADVENVRFSGVPPYLKNSQYKGAARPDAEKGYLYPHDFPGHYVPQRYLPEELAGRVYYKASENGVESRIREMLEKRREAR